MTKLEFTNKVIDNLNSSMALNGKINLEKFIDLTNKQYEAINYMQCCTQLLCISDDFNFITKGRMYNMEDEPDGHYVVIDDFGEKRLLWKHYFEIVQ